MFLPPSKAKMFLRLQNCVVQYVLLSAIKSSANGKSLIFSTKISLVLDVNMFFKALQMEIVPYYIFLKLISALNKKKFHYSIFFSGVQKINP